jgi:RimJ/RimL family protein N-acetyltransferase
VLATERLTLRQMEPSDLDFVASMLADPLVMRYYPTLLSRAEAEAWLGRRLAQYASHGFSLWLAVEADRQRPVGQVGLIPQLVGGVEEAEVAYLIASSCWRRGFASEAAMGVRDYAFDVLGRPRVISLVRPENTPSRGVARKVGMEVVGRTLHAGLEHLVFARERMGARLMAGSPP